jgi:hypothetical protein
VSSWLRIATVVFVLPLLAASACTLRGAFFEDRRVTILRPEDRSEVNLPVTLEWQVTNFTTTSPDGTQSNDRGYFGIFIDRAPMPPGDDLASLAEGDLQCAEDPSCPDRAWFAANGVFYTTATSFELKHLVDTRPEERPDAPDRHEVTIVLLNGRSERIGETSFTVDLEVLREAQAS